MNAMTDPYAAFFARGGKITHCPPAYVAPVIGADPLGKVDAKTINTFSHSDKYAKARAKAVAKQRAKAIKEGAAPEEAKSSRVKSSTVDGYMRMVAARKEGRLRRVLAVIDGDWTHERLCLAAHEEGLNYRALRCWLRSNGYAEKLPNDSGKNSGPKKSPEMAERDASIRADYAGNMPGKEIRAKYGISERQLGRICKGVKRGPKPKAALELEMVDLYQTGMTPRAVAEAVTATHGVKVSQFTVRFALKRAGVPIRNSKEASALRMAREQGELFGAVA